MADELIENAEFGKKRKNEEDPILIAQRFLNIYRQMHIFNPDRQEQFNNMLLDMPPDIRILLSTLPGGSLLLEYIEEIEEKRGLIPVTIKPENSFRKGGAKELLKQSTPVAEKTGNKQSSGGGVIIDASFASELSSSLSIALQQTERRYKEDIKALTETITQSVMQSQVVMANMMKDILLVTHQPIKDSPSQTIITNKNDIPALSASRETSIENTTASTPASSPAQRNNKKSPAEAVAAPIEELKAEAVVVAPIEELKADVAKKATSNATQEPIKEKNTDKQEPPLKKEAMTNSSAILTDDSNPDANLDNKNEPVAETPVLQEEVQMELPAEKSSINLGRIEALSKDLSKRMGFGKNKQQETTDNKTIENLYLNLADIDSKEDTASILDNKTDSDADFNFDELLGDLDDSSSDISLPFNEPEKNVYQDELEQIRQALKGEKTAQQSVFSLDDTPDEPVSLDDIPDEPVSLDDVLDSSTGQLATDHAPKANAHEDNQDWEWEYVDDKTSQNADEDSDDWEWEYVEDDTTDEDSDEWEWEYVEDGDKDTTDGQK